MMTDLGEVVREAGLADWAGGPDDPWSVVQAVNVLEWGAVGTSCYDRLEMLLRAVTLDRFILSANMVRGFNSVRDFLGIAKGCYEDRLEGRWTWDGGGSPWRDTREVERYMAEVLDAAKRSRVWYPAGWLKVLTEIRATLNPAAYRQPRDPLTGRVLSRAPRPRMSSLRVEAERG